MLINIMKEEQNEKGRGMKIPTEGLEGGSVQRKGILKKGGLSIQKDTLPLSTKTGGQRSSMEI